MSYIFQKIQTAVKQVEGKNIFVEGYITECEPGVTHSEKENLLKRQNLAETLAASIKRIRLTGEIILTFMSENNTLRVTKINVESRQFLSNEEGLLNQRLVMRQNLEQAIDITIDKLLECGASRVETGMLEQPGSRAAIAADSGSIVNWWTINQQNGVLGRISNSFEEDSLLAQIIDNTVSKLCRQKSVAM